MTDKKEKPLASKLVRGNLTRRERVINALRADAVDGTGKLTRNEIAECIDLDPAAVTRALGVLHDEGAVVMENVDGYTCWSLAEPENVDVDAAVRRCAGWPLSVCTVNDPEKCMKPLTAWLDEHGFERFEGEKNSPHHYVLRGLGTLWEQRVPHAKLSDIKKAISDRAVDSLLVVDDPPSKPRTAADREKLSKLWAEMEPLIEPGAVQIWQSGWIEDDPFLRLFDQRATTADSEAERENDLPMCPKCGGAAVHGEADAAIGAGRDYWVRCQNASCITGPTARTKAAAAAAWRDVCAAWRDETRPRVDIADDARMPQRCVCGAEVEVKRAGKNGYSITCPNPKCHAVVMGCNSRDAAITEWDRLMRRHEIAYEIEPYPADDDLLCDGSARDADRRRRQQEKAAVERSKHERPDVDLPPCPSCGAAAMYARQPRMYPAADDRDYWVMCSRGCGGREGPARPTAEEAAWAWVELCGAADADAPNPIGGEALQRLHSMLCDTGYPPRGAETVAECATRAVDELGEVRAVIHDWLESREFDREPGEGTGEHATRVLAGLKMQRDEARRELRRLAGWLDDRYGCIDDDADAVSRAIRLLESCSECDPEPEPLTPEERDAVDDADLDEIRALFPLASALSDAKRADAQHVTIPDSGFTCPACGTAAEWRQDLQERPGKIDPAWFSALACPAGCMATEFHEHPADTMEEWRELVANAATFAVRVGPERDRDDRVPEPTATATWAGRDPSAEPVAGHARCGDEIDAGEPLIVAGRDPSRPAAPTVRDLLRELTPLLAALAEKLHE